MHIQSLLLLHLQTAKEQKKREENEVKEERDRERATNENDWADGSRSKFKIKFTLFCVRSLARSRYKRLYVCWAYVYHKRWREKMCAFFDVVIVM